MDPDIEEEQRESGKGELGKGKKQVRWTPSMDNVLLDTLVEQARIGNKQGVIWDAAVWDIVIAAILGKTKCVVDKKNIENRLRTMKIEYVTYCEIIEKSGFGWDSTKTTVQAADEKWEELFSNPVNKKYKPFRDRCVKWSFDKLVVVCGKHNASGEESLGGHDCINLEKSDEESKLHVEEEEHNVDDIEGGSSRSSGKRPVTSTPPKRQHGKKIRLVDVVKDMIVEMGGKLEKLTHYVDPMLFGKQLQGELMKAPGFSKRYLNAAFGILRRDPIEGEIFLLRDEEFRVEMLKELRDKIGDI